MKQPKTALDLFKSRLHIIFNMQKYANDVETSLQLLQAVSMLCFRFI